jgi:hypothetical protein
MSEAKRDTSRALPRGGCLIRPSKTPVRLSAGRALAEYSASTVARTPTVPRRQGYEPSPLRLAGLIAATGTSKPRSCMSTTWL